jgi:hypothetical protein
MLNKLKSWWKKLRRKRFRITDEYSATLETSEPSNHDQPLSLVRRKSFRITNEYSVTSRPDQSVNNDQSPSSVSGFSVVARTRPKQCPVCRTADRITRLESKDWKCEECGYTWR